MIRFFLILISCVFTFQLYAESSDKQTYIVKTSSTLNVRAEKSTQSAIVTKLANGSKVIVNRIEGEWAQIDCNGLPGYVKTDYISQSSESEYTETNSRNVFFSRFFQFQVSGLPLGTWLICFILWLSVGGLFLNTIRMFNANAIHWPIFNVLTLIILIIISVSTIILFYGLFNSYITQDQYEFHFVSGFWRVVLIMISMIFIWIQQLFLFRNFYQWLCFKTEYINVKISVYPILFSFAAFLLAQIAGNHKFSTPTYEIFKEDLLYNNSFFDFLFALSVIAVVVCLIVQIIYLTIKLRNHAGYLLIALPVFILSYSSLLLISFFAALCALVFLIAGIFIMAMQKGSEGTDRARCCENCKHFSASCCAYGNQYISNPHKKICSDHEY